jgi:flagellar biosynthesis GTPase FlhF
MSQEQPDTHTYRGRSLEELVPRIRSELGDDAVIVARRETTTGGVGGFFARREIEVEVRPGAAAAAQAFAAQLAQAQERQSTEPAPPFGGVRPAVSPEIDALPSASDLTVDDLFTPPPARGGGLAALFDAGLPRAADPAKHEPAAPPPAMEAEEEDDVEAGEDGRLDPEAVEGHAVEAHEDEDDQQDAARPLADVEQPTGTFDFLAGVVPAAPEPELLDEPLAAAPPEPQPITEGPPPVHAASPDTATPVAAPVGLPADAQAVADRLAARGLRADLADAVARDAMVGLAPLDPTADPRELVVDALARRIPVHPLRHGPGVIAFVGPGGAGKSRCVARLAAAYARHSDLPITVISLRPQDEGAEMTRLLAPYDALVIVVASGPAGAGHIAALRANGLVILDTPGVSPRNPSELRDLAADLAALAPDEVHLTVPATSGPDAARELMAGVMDLGVGALVLTHTDETAQLGTGLGLAIDTGVPLSYLARGQAVDMGLRPASAVELARDLESWR